ncbi:MAG: hypothetical protein ACSLFK_05965 [Gemmatimonadaceae bacterium]
MELKTRNWILATLLAFALLLLLLALTHDVWRDEVRAFSVATRPDSWRAMFSALGEEGHPVVWYALLRAGYAVTGSLMVLPVLAALIGLAAGWLILRWSPFPPALRFLALFGVFLGYELSIVARNYGIGVLLMLIVCALWGRRADRPWRLAIVLAVLANTSVHGAVAAALFSALWLADMVRRDMKTRPPAFAGAIALVVAGIALAIHTASSPPEMAYAFSWSSLTPASVFGALLVDPGLGLKGTDGANLVASGEIPWGRIGLDSGIASRILVNIAVVAAAWGLRRNRIHLLALILAVLLFELVFTLVYPGALRHHGFLAFLILTICWIAVVTTRPDDRAAAARRITLGLIPLFAIQTAALPFTMYRHIVHPESMGLALAREIRSNSAYAGAVLMSEPDPLIETLPFYVRNPTYFPRQREYDYRAYFDRGDKRQLDLGLGQLMAIANSVACNTRQPVLLSIGHRRFHFDESGTASGPYGAIFTWTPDEKQRFAERSRPLRWFPGSTGDENYRTYEIACMMQGEDSERRTVRPQDQRPLQSRD